MRVGDPRVRTTCLAALWLLMPTWVNAGVEPGPSDRVCTLAGEGSPHASNREIWGPDLGDSFEHEGKLWFLYGDTCFDLGIGCGIPSPNDDVMAISQGDVEDLDGGICIEQSYGSDVFGNPTETQLFNGWTQLDMGPLRTPTTGFSDGQHAFGVFSRARHTRCEGGLFTPDCASHLTCDQSIGECLLSDPTGETPVLCMDDSQCAGVGLGVCAFGAGFCTDPTERSTDPIANVAQDLIIAKSDEGGNAHVFRQRYRWSTAKFRNGFALTTNLGDPSSPIDTDLLIFGRPAFFANTEGDAVRSDMYLLRHDLSAFANVFGTVSWNPEFYCADAEPDHWCESEADAVPVFDEEDDLEVLNQHSVAYVEELESWIMIYGGNVPLPRQAAIFPQPDGTLLDRSIVFRSAPAPEGPWSAPQKFLDPHDLGYVGRAGDPGSGGPFLHSQADCVPGPLPCPPFDPLRFYINLVFPTAPGFEDDPGFFYGAYLIEELTEPAAPLSAHPDAVAANLYWVVSTWNPYRVHQMRTHVELVP